MENHWVQQFREFVQKKKKKRLLLSFHRQTSLAFQSIATLENEVELPRMQNACLFQEIKTANKKAMCYLEDMHSAELRLC